MIIRLLCDVVAALLLIALLVCIYLWLPGAWRAKLKTWVRARFSAFRSAGKSKDMAGRQPAVSIAGPSHVQPGDTNCGRSTGDARPERVLTASELDRAQWSWHQESVSKQRFDSAWTITTALRYEAERPCLDMHGLDVGCSLQALDLMLAECQRAGIRRLRVITGVGNRSRRGPKLMPNICHRLSTLKARREVTRFDVDQGHIDIYMRSN